MVNNKIRWGLVTFGGCLANGIFGYSITSVTAVPIIVLVAIIFGALGGLVME